MSDKAGMFPHDNSLEKLPFQEREKKLNEKLRKLIKYAFEKAPGFAARMKAARLTLMTFGIIPPKLKGGPLARQSGHVPAR